MNIIENTIAVLLKIGAIVIPIFCVIKYINEVFSFLEKTPLIICILEKTPMIKKFILRHRHEKTLKKHWLTWDNNKKAWEQEPYKIYTDTAKSTLHNLSKEIEKIILSTEKYHTNNLLRKIILRIYQLEQKRFPICAKMCEESFWHDGDKIFEELANITI